jgi:hypothetical protein
MTFLRNFAVIGAIVFACYFAFRDHLPVPSPPAATEAALDSETLSAAEKFTRDWFDRHGDMPRDQAAPQFMHDADAWAVAYRTQHGLPPLTFRQRDALRDKLCARVRCGG